MIRMLVAVVAVMLLANGTHGQEIRKNVDIVEALANAPLYTVGEKPFPQTETVQFESCVAATATLFTAECFVYYRGELIMSVPLFYGRVDENNDLIEILSPGKRIDLARNCFDREVRDRCWVTITGVPKRTYDPKDKSGNAYITVEDVTFDKR